MPPPPPPPPPMAALASPVKRAGGPPPPPPPPPPSMATGAIPRRAPPPPPPPSAPAVPKPSAGKPRAVPPPPPSSKPSAGKNRPPRPPTPPRSRGPPKAKARAAPPPPPSKKMPSQAPPIDDFADLDVDASKFPSFTMDDNTFEFADITNTAALQDLPPPRSSFGTSKRHSVGFTTMDSEDSQTPWKQPLDPMAIPAAGQGNDEDTGFDVPDRLTVGPGAAAARLDLQRCTIRVHKQLVEKLKTNSMTSNDHATAKSDENGNVDGDLSRCQGELWLKSRFRMLGWKKRYGSIVDHAYYGPVLFLFKYDAKGDVALKHSLMIVLVDSEVRLGKNSTTKDNGYRCEFELRTTKRKYIVAANHTMRRDYWLRNLQHIQQYTKS